MCSERTRARLEDIIDNVDRVASYIGSMTFAAYVEDGRTMDAVERCLERIAEAVVQIGEAEAERLGLGVPWRKVKGLGNKLRHEYRRINPRDIFDTAQDDLPPLREAALAALKV